MDQDLDFIQRSANVLSRYKAEVCSGLAVLFGAAAGWLYADSKIWAFVLALLALVVTVCAGVLAKKRLARLDELQAELTEANRHMDCERDTIRRLLQGLSVSFMKEAKFWNAATSRLSVYGHVGNELFLICRVSHNAQYEKPHRPKYPDNQGHLGQCWENGYTYVVGMFPSSMKAEAKKLGMPSEVVDSLVMIPRSIVGRRIDDAQSNKGSAEQ